MKQIPRKSKESTRSYIYRTLKQSIIEFYFYPGERLSEPSIADVLNVSRTPVREALILLENEGLIVVNPKQGTFVSKLSVSAIHQFLFLRKTIEREVIRIACELRTENDINALNEQLNAQKVLLEIKDGRIAMYLLDNLYHKMIYDIAQQTAAWRTLQQIAGSYNRLRSMEVLDPSYSDRRYREHIELLHLITHRETEAIAAFVDKHLDALDSTLPIFIEKHPQYFTE